MSDDQEQQGDGGGEETRRGRPRKPITPFAMIAHDVWNNRKVRRAGPLGLLVFIFALTRNATRGRTGSFAASELEPWYLADQLRISEPEASQALQRAVEAGLLAIDGDVAVIVGWDETWARRSLTESEQRQIRRKNAGAGDPPPPPKKNKTSTRGADTQTKKEREKKRSPDFVRTNSEAGVRVAREAALEPPMSSEEEENAWVIIRRLGSFLGKEMKSTREEREHIARLLRRYALQDLIALLVHTCEQWAYRAEMRQHCNVFRIFSEKNVRESLAVAASERAS